MKTDMTTTPAPAASVNYPSDSTKLVSLLAMATGAVAIPQIGNADIIYTDMNSSPVVVGYGGVDSFLFNNLPGSAQFGFQRNQSFTTSTTSTFGSTFTITYRTVLAGQLGGTAIAGVRGLANGFAAPLAPGASWNAGGVNTFYSVAVGTASNYAHRPTFGYDHNYLAWVFADSSQGNALRYGWVEISLSIGNITANPASGPNVTIWGYAWENTGVKPGMGDMPVPEPSSAALMVFGAMALGARGLRNWRRDRDTASKS